VHPVGSYQRAIFGEFRAESHHLFFSVKTVKLPYIFEQIYQEVAGEFVLIDINSYIQSRSRQP